MVRKRFLALLGLAALFGLLFSGAPSPARAQENIYTRANNGTLRPARIHTAEGDRVLPFISAGTLRAAMPASTNASAARAGAAGNAAGADVAQSAPAAAADTQAGPAGNTVGVSRSSLGCGNRNPSVNVRVNQDCSYRLQGEEVVKFNPANPRNLIAGMNDERQGYNLNAFAYSLNGGRTWGDDPPPFYHKINNPAAEEPTATDPNRHTIVGGDGNFFTYDGGSDPAVAVDLEGRAFYSNIIFDRAAGNGSAVVVAESLSGAAGTFYNDIAPFSRRYVVAEDNSLLAAHDKEFIVADTTRGSPNVDNVYITWTVFKFDPSCGAAEFCASPIYGSMSTDHARTWSTPELISGISPTLCVLGNQFDPTQNPHACNNDQGSDPMTLPNGDLAVVFNNFNAPVSTVNSQQLAVHCHPTGSSPAGTAHLNCAAPTKVGNDVTKGEPQCDFGRGPEECIPGSFVRTDDFPRIAINHGNGHLYATWQDYRGGEFDIQLSESTDGGLTWTEAKSPVNPDRGKDHYQAAVDVVCSGPLTANNANCPSSPSSGVEGFQSHALCPSTAPAAPAQSAETATGDHVAISYYRTCQVPNQNQTPPGGAFAPGQPGVQAENSDFTLSGGHGRATPYAARPVSPLFPPSDGNQAGFMGDYTGITVIGDVAAPIWSDNRVVIPTAFQADQDAVHDQDIYLTMARVPRTFDENTER
ncbi:hypothetical protein [Candidatus Nephthysia bennettiae]|uniref:Exo-alpha-sialidase n=1 Tax=Candidatus Nephthysia bennettiae TaxID=3127016 RepID=A0A934K214_9BACT|nr:hypothetical protein [Candidatus Dormibacteraeota bacterium]